MTLHSADQPVLLEGRLVAEALFPRFKDLSQKVKQARGRPPGLGVLSVGDHPPSQIYVGRKRDVAESLGFFFHLEQLDAKASLVEVLHAIDDLTSSDALDGLIVQLPLPAHLPVTNVLERMDPSKDVDGLHPLNAGLLFVGSNKGMVPCTPWGCLALLDFYHIPIEGRHVVIVGRSVLVGRPLAALFLRRHATVTIAHSRTSHLKKITQAADIVCVAAGQKNLIDASYVHDKSVVLDIGIHRDRDSVAGDVNFEAVSPHVAALSPVPGGVGPLTVMGLMHNTLRAACARSGVAFE
jgi:methylenetetrahydrofolate dehydrogenase (NADP+)/methenyltetrahydrofolate cyclohydrolase